MISIFKYLSLPFFSICSRFYSGSNPVSMDNSRVSDSSSDESSSSGSEESDTDSESGSEDSAPESEEDVRI